MDLVIKVLIYHSRMKHITSHGKYKTLKGAMRSAIKARDYYRSTNANWMYVWIGQI